jgi:hypothetical protein
MPSFFYFTMSGLLNFGVCARAHTAEYAAVQALNKQILPFGTYFFVMVNTACKLSYGMKQRSHFFTNL